MTEDQSNRIIELLELIDQTKRIIEYLKRAQDIALRYGPSRAREWPDALKRGRVEGECAASGNIALLIQELIDEVRYK